MVETGPNKVLAAELYIFKQVRKADVPARGRFVGRSSIWCLNILLVVFVLGIRRCFVLVFVLVLVLVSRRLLVVLFSYAS